MRILPTLLAVVSLAATTSCNKPPPTQSTATTNSPVGEWVQLNPRKDVAKQVKIWTESGIFMWVAKTETGATRAGGWGRYTYENGKYTEEPEAMPDGIEVLVGTRIPLELTFRKDGMLNLKGVLPVPGGVTVNEDYRRIGPPPSAR